MESLYDTQQPFNNNYMIGNKYYPVNGLEYEIKQKKNNAIYWANLQTAVDFTHVSTCMN